jgi:hypothetical protein
MRCRVVKSLVRSNDLEIIDWVINAFVQIILNHYFFWFKSILLFSGALILWYLLLLLFHKLFGIVEIFYTFTVFISISWHISYWFSTVFILLFILVINLRARFIIRWVLYILVYFNNTHYVLILLIQVLSWITISTGLFFILLLFFFIFLELITNIINLITHIKDLSLILYNIIENSLYSWYLNSFGNYFRSLLLLSLDYCLRLNIIIIS